MRYAIAFASTVVVTATADPPGVIALENGAHEFAVNRAAVLRPVLGQAFAPFRQRGMIGPLW